MVSRSTITILDGQKRSFDVLKARYTIEQGKNVNTNEFFGIMLQSYQDYKIYLDKIAVERLIGKKAGKDNV